MSPVCGAGPQFDGLGLTSFSDTQPAEQYFCLVPGEQLHLMKQLPSKLNAQLSVNKAIEMEIMSALSQARK